MDTIWFSSYFVAFTRLKLYSPALINEIENHTVILSLQRLKFNEKSFSIYSIHFVRIQFDLWSILEKRLTIHRFNFNKTDSFLLLQRTDQCQLVKRNMLGQIISKFKSLKREYLDLSPREKWESVRNIGIFILTLTGVPVLDPSFKVTWYSFAAIIIAIDVQISFIYTIWYFADTPMKAFLMAPMFGTIIPVIGNSFRISIFPNNYFQSNQHSK